MASFAFNQRARPRPLTRRPSEDDRVRTDAQDAPEVTVAVDEVVADLDLPHVPIFRTGNETHPTLSGRRDPDKGQRPRGEKLLVRIPSLPQALGS